VIDPIHDDPEDAGENAASDLSWADCPMLARGEMLAIIARQKDLDGRAVNLFRSALQGKPRSDLVEHYLGPNLYHPGSHYIYTNPDPDRIKLKNWRPDITAFAVEHQSLAPCAVFSNPLAWIGKADLAPSQRTYNAGFAERISLLPPDAFRSGVRLSTVEYPPIRTSRESIANCHRLSSRDDPNQDLGQTTAN
jgi:hypothetical protein